MFKHSISFPIGLALAIVLIDQLTKLAATHSVGPSAPHREKWIVGDWLGLAYGENSGVAFGLLKGSPSVILTIAVLVGVAAVGWFLWSYRANPLVLVAGGLIAGGAIGNLLDRIRFGHVRDFIAVGPWPSFNVADSAITIGALVAVAGIWRSGIESASDPETREPATRAALDTHR